MRKRRLHRRACIGSRATVQIDAVTVFAEGDGPPLLSSVTLMRAECGLGYGAFRG